ncbi:MAG: TrmH family RNA methyltransferase [Spirochaetota bacterium]
MITLRKLSRLPPKLLVKKAAYLFHSFGLALEAGEQIDWQYVSRLAHMSELHAAVSQPTAERLLLLACKPAERTSRYLIFVFDDLYYALLSEIGASPADWDMTEQRDSRIELSRSSRTVLPFHVYLDRLRSPFNVGSIFRTADSFGVDKILLGEGSASPEHPRAKRSARGCEGSVEWQSVAEQEIYDILDGPVFALELGGTPINEFPFPQQGTMVVGSEELGVSPELAQIARRSLGFVSIPLGGTKGSLNVSVAFGIIMHAWYQACILKS